MRSFFSFLLLVSAISALAQKYTPFPYSNSKWQVNYYCGVSQDCYTTPDPIVFYSITGDTIVNGVQYQKLNTGGAIRQNELKKKVFYLPPNSNKDTLLYDFNLKVNDTLPTTFHSCTSLMNGTDTVMTVTSIDSIQIGVSYYRKYNIKGCGSGNYLIEGVGSNCGLLEGVYTPFEGSTVLACFNNNNVPNNHPGASCLVQGVINNVADIENIKIYPVPSVNEINVVLNKEESGILSIMDVNQKVLKSVYYSGKNITISINDLKDGIYFLNISNSNSIINKKIVKVAY